MASQQSVMSTVPVKVMSTAESTELVQQDQHSEKIDTEKGKTSSFIK